MTIQQVHIFFVIADQEGRTLDEVAEVAAEEYRVVARAVQLLATVEPIPLLSKRWWRGPRREKQRLGLIEIRAGASGRSSARTAHLTEKGRSLISMLEEIVSHDGVRAGKV